MPLVSEFIARYQAKQLLGSSEGSGIMSSKLPYLADTVGYVPFRTFNANKAITDMPQGQKGGYINSIGGDIIYTHLVFFIYMV